MAEDGTKFKITINKDAVPYDGEYIWDMEEPFDGDDLHLIKQESGVRFGEITEALGAADYDLILAITAVVLRREGRVTQEGMRHLVKMLRSLKTGVVVLDKVEEEAEVEERPPVSATPNGDESGPVEPSVAPESLPPSLPALRSIGDLSQETTPPVTGDPGLAADAG